MVNPGLTFVGTFRLRARAPARGHRRRRWSGSGSAPHPPSTRGPSHYRIWRTRGATVLAARRYGGTCTERLQGLGHGRHRPVSAPAWLRRPACWRCPAGAGPSWSVPRSFEAASHGSSLTEGPARGEHCPPWSRSTGRTKRRGEGATSSPSAGAASRPNALHDGAGPRRACRDPDFLLAVAFDAEERP